MSLTVNVPASPQARAAAAISRVHQLVSKAGTAPLSPDDIKFLAQHRSLLLTPPVLPYAGTLAMSLSGSIHQSIVRGLSSNDARQWVPSVPTAFAASQILLTLFRDVDDTNLNAMRPSINDMARGIADKLCALVDPRPLKSTAGKYVPAVVPALPVNVRVVLVPYLGVNWLLLGATVTDVGTTLPDSLRHFRDTGASAAMWSVDLFRWFGMAVADTVVCLLESKNVSNRVQLAKDIVMDSCTTVKLRVPAFDLTQAMTMGLTVLIMVFKIHKNPDADSAAVKAATEFEEAVFRAACDRISAHASGTNALDYFVISACNRFTRDASAIIAKRAKELLVLGDEIQSSFAPLSASGRQPPHYGATLMLLALERCLSLSVVRDTRTLSVPTDAHVAALAPFSKLISDDGAVAALTHFFRTVLLSHRIREDIQAKGSVELPSPLLLGVAKMLATSFTQSGRTAHGRLVPFFAAECEVLGQEVGSVVVAEQPARGLMKSSAKVRSLRQFSYGAMSLLFEWLPGVADVCNPQHPALAARIVQALLPIAATALEHSASTATDDASRRRHANFVSRVKFLVGSVFDATSAAAAPLKLMLEQAKSTVETNDSANGNYHAMRAAILLWGMAGGRAKPAGSSGPASRAPVAAAVVGTYLASELWIPTCLRGCRSPAPLVVAAAHDAFLAFIRGGHPLILHAASSYIALCAPTPNAPAKYGVPSLILLRIFWLSTDRVCRSVEQVGPAMSTPTLLASPTAETKVPATAETSRPHAGVPTGPDVGRHLIRCVAANAKYWIVESARSNQQEHAQRKVSYVTALINTLLTTHASLLQETCGALEDIFLTTLTNRGEIELYMTTIERLLTRSDVFSTKPSLVEWLLELSEKVALRVESQPVLRRAKL